MALEQWADLLFDADALLALSPKDTTALFLRGKAHNFQHNYRRAVADFQRVLEIKGSGDAALFNLLGTSLAVHPFAGLVGEAPAGTPRMLINREKVGERHVLSGAI